MDFQKYIELTRETAVYPDEYERDYVIHGLVDELGELQETLDNPPIENRLVSERFSPGARQRFSSEHVNEIEKEMGDVLWYTARLVDHFGFDVQKFFEFELSETTMSPLDQGEELVNEALLCATRINGHQKKSVRDEDNREDQIKGRITSIIRKLRKAAHHFGLRDLEVVARRNIEKLFDRKARDVIHGDGDNR